MKIISIVLAGVLAVEFVSFGAAKLAAVGPMRQRAAHLGVTEAVFRGVGALEVAAAGGVLFGLVAPVVGVAAGLGLALLMCGAITSHLRRGDGMLELLPAAGSGLAAVAYMVAVVGASS
ncbi:DoxX family protein [Nocardia sp. NPDC055165]